MWNKLFSIRTTDPLAVTRGRIIKLACLALIVLSAADIPIIVNDPTAPKGLVGVLAMIVLIFSGIWLLAHFGYIRSAGIIYAVILALVNTLANNPEEMAVRSIGTAYIIPILVIGVVAGSTASLIMSGLSLILFVGVTLGAGVTWSSWTYISAFILIISGALLWALTRALEQALAQSQRQLGQLAATQDELLTQKGMLEDINTHLSATNTEQSRLLETIQALEAPIIPVSRDTAIVPLIGYLDDTRMKAIGVAVRNYVHRQRVRFILIDVTGITDITSKLIQDLIKLILSLRMMGSEAAVTGLNADMALEIVSDSAVDAELFQTFSTLEAGLMYAARGQQRVRAGEHHEHSFT